MGGIDKNNHMVALYRTRHKSQRWYLPIYFYLVDLCLTNSWILAKRSETWKDITFEDYKLIIADNLMFVGRDISKRPVGRPKASTSTEPEAKKKQYGRRSETPTPDLRSDKIDHFPDHYDINGRGKCRHCHKGMTTVYCMKCKVRLCFTSTRNCFNLYHQ